MLDSLIFLSFWVGSAFKKEAYFWVRRGLFLLISVKTATENNFLIGCHGIDTGYVSPFAKMVILPISRLES